MRIEYHSIGVVHSPFTSTEGMPIQSSRDKGTKATVVLQEEYGAGLRDLEGFSHLLLLCHFHRSRPYKLMVVPFLDDQPRGLFATRAPSRPNPIGLSLVKLDRIVENTIYITGVDLLDQTPVLDIKPYVGEFDGVGNARFGWLEKARKRRRKSDKRFEQ